MIFEINNHPEIRDHVFSKMSETVDMIMGYFETVKDKWYYKTNIQGNVNWELAKLHVSLDPVRVQLTHKEMLSFPCWLSQQSVNALVLCGMPEEFTCAPCAHCHAEGIARVMRGNFRAGRPNTIDEVKSLVNRAIKESHER